MHSTAEANPCRGEGKNVTNEPGSVKVVEEYI